MWKHSLLQWKNIMQIENLVKAACDAGAFKATVITARHIETDICFRHMCVSNACGMYGKNWMCPPAVGEISALTAQLKLYDHALVYQSVCKLKDHFDFEGMMEAQTAHRQLSHHISAIFRGQETLHLGAGACTVCRQCAMITGENCRHPDLAIPSLEAYGVNVIQLAKAADMRYINGEDTVTYFGAVLFH